MGQWVNGVWVNTPGKYTGGGDYYGTENPPYLGNGYQAPGYQQTYGDWTGMANAPMNFEAMQQYQAQQVLPTSPAAAAPAAPAEPVAPTTQPPASGSSFNPVGFGLGAIQAGVGLYQLNKLSKTPVPEYTASAATLAANQRAQQMSQMGYTPSQTAAFKANMGTALNTQFANQRNLAGGGLAGALGARGTAQKLQAMNQFAVGDADRQMGNIRYADEQTAGLQRMQNMNTEAAMRRRLMTEQALGQAVQQGTVNMAGAFDTGASFAKFAGMFGGAA
jgi:hypothetical protein